MLTLTADDECILKRAPNAIRLHEILTVARNQKSGDFIARDTRVPAVDALNARLERALRAACADETLEEVAREVGVAVNKARLDSALQDLAHSRAAQKAQGQRRIGWRRGPFDKFHEIEQVTRLQLRLAPNVGLIRTARA